MDDSNEFLIYDKENDTQVRMDRVAINDKDKAFLQCLYESDTYLNTMEIGQMTGIDRNLIHYRYDKFGRKRYTEILDVRNIDPDRLPKKLENMKEVQLTDKGRKLLENGLIGSLDEDHISEKIVLTEEEFKDQVMTVRSLQDTIEQQRQEITHLEEEVSSMRKEMSSFRDWRKRMNTIVIAARSSINSLDIDFNKHLQEAKQETDEEEQELYK